MGTNELPFLRLGDFGAIVDADGLAHATSLNPRLDHIFAAAPALFAALEKAPRANPTIDSVEYEARYAAAVERAEAAIAKVGV